MSKREYPDEELAFATVALLQFVARADKTHKTRWSYSPEFTKLAVMLFGFIDGKGMPAISTPLVDALKDAGIDEYLTARLDMLQKEEQRLMNERTEFRNEKARVEEKLGELVAVIGGSK